MHSDPGSPNKENEDWCGAESNIAIVLDGVTAPPELPTGCIHGVPWYVDRLGKAFLKAAGRGDQLTVALERAIADVNSQHEGTCDLANAGTPSATVAAARWSDPEQVEILVLSDATSLIESSDGIRVLTDRRLNRVAEAERQQVGKYAIGSPEHKAAVLDVVREQRRWRNRAGGYPLAASTPEIALSAKTATAPTAEVRSLALMSDGVSCLVDEYGTDAWEDVLRRLHLDGPSGLVQHVRQVEHSDAMGEQWTRYKASDDATIVFVVP